MKHRLISRSLLFTTLIAIMLYTGTEQQVISRPLGMHVWRKSLSLSHARHYAETDSSFWDPKLFS